MKKLKSKKKICLVTSSRADYSLMSKLIDNLKKCKYIDFTLLITGQHLSKNMVILTKQSYKNIEKLVS